MQLLLLKFDRIFHSEKKQQINRALVLLQLVEKGREGKQCAPQGGRGGGKTCSENLHRSWNACSTAIWPTSQSAPVSQVLVQLRGEFVCCQAIIISKQSSGGSSKNLTLLHSSDCSFWDVQGGEWRNTMFRKMVKIIQLIFKLYVSRV